MLYKKRIIHLLSIITGLYIIYYIIWRGLYTLNPAAMVFSVVLLIAEIMGVINFFLFVMMTWKTDKIKPQKALRGVSVDVFVPTYNEDLHVLEATIVGCMRMRMEHKTYLLDDGHREEVRELAAKMGCGYLSREKNTHAKAGNINEALSKTKGEFVVVVDADMVPQPDFLEKTLGYFRNKKTAIVQMPQEFFNLDSMQHQKAGSFWHEQQLFYHVIQPGKNNIDAAFWCGSPSILRRAAIMDVGGVATDCITEDFLTSIRLNAKGWKICYHDEPLAFGIAPQSFHAFSVQRLRWAQGSMKIFRSKDNPLIKRGLKWRQRLSHFAAIFAYFDAYQKLIYLLTPAILLLTGIMPLKVTGGLDFLLHWLPYFLLSMLTNKAIGRGYFKYFSVEKFNTLKMVTFIKASFSLLWSKNIFKVTPKSASASVKKKDRRALNVQIAILLILIVSIIFASVNSIWNVLVSYPSTAAVVVALFWSAFNITVLALALYEVFKKKYARQDYRFDVSLNGWVDGACGGRNTIQVGNISRGGASLTLAEQCDLSNVKSINVRLPDGAINLTGSVVFESKEEDGKRRVGYKFGEITNGERERLYNFLFVTKPRMIYNEGGMSPKEVSLPDWHGDGPAASRMAETPES